MQARRWTIGTDAAWQSNQRARGRGVPVVPRSSHVAARGLAGQSRLPLLSAPQGAERLPNARCGRRARCPASCRLAAVRTMGLRQPSRCHRLQSWEASLCAAPSSAPIRPRRPGLRRDRAEALSHAEACQKLAAALGRGSAAFQWMTRRCGRRC